MSRHGPYVIPVPSVMRRFGGRWRSAHRQTGGWAISWVLGTHPGAMSMQSTDVIVVGGGLAGLVAATELTDAGKHVLVVEQEPEQSLGGQAFWSFGGLFFVDSPEQRRMGVRDSHALALTDWMGSAGFDRPEDEWPRRWA